MVQERTYIVESGRPASHTKSSTARSTNSGHVPMAEMIYRDQARLPDRFRYKPVDVAHVTLTRTVPVSPMLHTYARKVSLFTVSIVMHTVIDFSAHLDLVHLEKQQTSQNLL